jgi:energy-coupling factor transport system permease protein
VTAVTADVYAESRPQAPLRFLHHLNPLAKLAAPLPVMVFVVVTRDPFTPLAFMVLGMLLLVIGAALRPLLVAALLLGVPASVAVLSLSFGLTADVDRPGETLLRIGGYAFTTTMLQSGFETGLRLGALLVLGLLAGATSTGPELVRAMVQQLRVPYRIGYTALAAFRFVPRFGHELGVIRSAHRIRGMTGGRGPIAFARRWLGYVVPLLAGAIRHAERVALAMDARAFGAHPTRTERHVMPFRARDWIFVLLFWAISATLLILIPRSELP